MISWFPARGPMIFGFLLFGHILPYLGWQRVPCHWDGEPADHDAMTGDPDGRFTCVLFHIEWLGLGLAFGRPKDVRPA